MKKVSFFSALTVTIPRQAAKSVLPLWSIYFLLLFIFSTITPAKAQTYSTDLRSLQTICNQDPFAPPVLRLNSEDIIQIQFDLLSLLPSWLNYRIVHCNMDGSPSSISELDYLNGFNDHEIVNYETSFNTFTPYTHYKLQLPNEQLSFNVSGRYRVEFYDSENPDQVLAQTTFYVSEDQAQISAQVTTNTNFGVNTEYQQVDLKVHTHGPMLANSASDLKVSVTQNNRPHSEVIVTTPTRIASNELTYEYLPSLVFEAGNNYRRFEITDQQYAGMGVDKIRTINNTYHCLLFADPIKKTKPYLYDHDQNGRFFIRALRTELPDVESDYLLVHFSIPTPYPLLQGQVHIQGDFLPNGISNESLMEYNFERKQYEKAVLLKQGLYNYQYVFTTEGQGKPSTLDIEGNKYETENEYLILTFLRRPGERYDRLVGFKQISNR